jgi:aminocarboxymuconate-semialdehyde decarboxylase
MPLDVIDFHSHFIPAPWQARVASDLSENQRRRWQRIAALIGDRTALRTEIDSGDLAGRVVNVPTALFHEPGEIPAPDVFRRANDSLAALVASGPGLHAIASVDAFDGERAARELERAVRDLGLRGVFVESLQGDKLLDAPEARPTLAAAAELGVPVFVHPVAPSAFLAGLARYPRAGLLYARGVLNAASLIALIESGRLDEFPTLPIVVTSLAIGGILLEAGFNSAAFDHDDGLGVLRRQVHVETMGFLPALIRAAVDVLGEDHVLAGSDWPIVNDGPIAPKLQMALARAGLDAAQGAKVAAGNSRRLLGIG